MPAPASGGSPTRAWSFCRAGIVEHLFGEVDPLSIWQRPYGLSAVPHALRIRVEPAPKAGEARVTVIDKCGQALKGVWWMSWHREAKKDVVACDKLREAGKRALIRRFPNEETQLGLLPVTPA